MNTTELRTNIEGRGVRLTNFIDGESTDFEKEAEPFFANAAVEQTLEYLKRSTRRSYLLQIRDPEGYAATQACIYVGQSRGVANLLGGFAMATVPKMASSKNGVEEEFGIKILRRICSELPGIMTLRLQPLRLSSIGLMNFQAYSLRQGFHVSDPLGPVRNLVLELGTSQEELHSKLPSKTKAKIRHAGLNRIEIRPITDPSYIPICKKANESSLQRSGAHDPTTSYDFEAAFSLAKAEPTRARILGVFLKNRPNELLAHMVGLRNGELAEYSSAGSLSDPELRSMPFNYFLLWEFMTWAREMGAKRMEMGGVTDGGPSDPLHGIARFKRSLCETEIETGREMTSILRPLRYGVYQSLKRFHTFFDPYYDSYFRIKELKAQKNLPTAEPELYTEKKVSSLL